LTEVADKHGVRVDDILGERRTAEIARARQEAMWRLRHELHLSFPVIGSVIGGRDHSTVFHGVHAHARRLREGLAA